jgi:hypothetical protein
MLINVLKVDYNTFVPSLIRAAYLVLCIANLSAWHVRSVGCRAETALWLASPLGHGFT